MDIDLPDGAMSSYKSGSSIRPPSQRFPKVSIGIMVEKTTKMGYEGKKDDETLLPLKETAPSSQEKIVEEDREPGTATIFAEKKVAGKENVFPRVSTRSMNYEIPNFQTIHFHAKASMLQSDGGLHEKLGGLTCERRENSGNVEKVEGIAFAAIQGVHLLHKGSASPCAKFREGGSEALRMKLWEALGPTSPQSRHISSPPLVNGNAKISKSDNYKENQTHEAPKPKQDTDTIETDSENPDMIARKGSPNQTRRRPFTRSLARKKDPGKTLPKLQLQKNNAGKHLSSSRAEKQKPEEKNIFTFDEGEKRMESSMFAANGHLPVSVQKKHEIKSARVTPQRISFPSRSASRKILQINKSLQTNAKEQPSPPPQNDANKTSAMQDTQTIHYEVKEKVQQPSNSIKSGRDAHSKNHHLEKLSNSSLANSSETRELDSPPLGREIQGSQGQPSSKDGYPHEKVSSPTLARGPRSLDHLYSPTFAVDLTPSPPERKSMENRCHSPILPEEKVPTRSFKFPPNPRACSSGSAAYPESSDGTRDSQVTPSGDSSPVVKQKAPEKCCSPSQVQPLSSERSEADEIVGKGIGKTGRWYSKTGGHSKSPFTLRHIKRVRSLGDIDVGKLDPSSGFPINSGTGEAVGFHCLSDQPPEDSLARAITQLAVVLERFKAKIRLHTCKKSSELLSSAGDSIRLQLQEVESLIQADMEKFTSLGKSKRKRLESTFLEQQEKLQAIHEKFKEEINQHVLDCKSTLKEVEAYQKELKGNVERQKAAHRKLVLQVKEAMEVQLADAETSIAAVHKAARKRMTGLKHALREWLTDDGTIS